MTYDFTPAVITQICNPIAELVIPIKIPTREAKKEEIETHSVIVKNYNEKVFYIVQNSTNLLVNLFWFIHFFE